jgi:thiol:disulfide interchange protein DsbA
MIRRVATLVAGLGVALAAVAAQKPNFPEENVHYREIPFAQPVDTGDKIEVREFFWYGCPHCYHLEPALNSWLKRMPTNAQFVRTPGVAESWLVHAQAYYAFESLGVLAKVHEPFFSAVQTDRGAYNTPEAIAKFVAKHGVDPKKFQDAYASFAVRLKLERAKRQNVDFGVQSVPTIAVDGRYLTSSTMAGGEEAVMKVVDFLIEKAAKDRKKTGTR